ncbi:polysaccharide deacetylase family protein [Bacillus gaemokensis]|uniref:Transcriptional regulator n=1 Tax=Bacillus gaemokensis TaxID=574375 RepID=A0A073KSX1_9BACI|nr:polysaccharide deacetylase family protein [Bacillus gaemokensis]KEK25458.1 transcriptional regulator [Bacillus gaemokensis]KYG37097.1 transcriptional regulator [Bacillus gaemokensis]
MKARESKGSKKLFIFIAVAVVLIGAIGFAVFSKGNKEQKVPVLLYHHLLTEKEKDSHPAFKNKGTTLSVEQFEKQIKYLADNKYHAITLKEFEEFMKEKKNLPKKSILITFDDASKSNYVYAYPILKKYKMHAASFVVTSRLSDKEEKFDSKIIQSLSKSEIDKMQDVFEFGSHTNALHKLEQGKAVILSKKDVEIKQDILESQKILKTNYFSYPFGKFNENVIKAVKESKFHVAFLNSSGYATRESDILKINRFGISPDTNMKEFSQIASGEYANPKK